MRSLIVSTLFLAVSVFAQEPVLEDKGVPCFLTTPELRTAVDAFLVDPKSPAIQKYGPIKNWCVRNIADFSLLFASNRNPKAVSFNEDLSGWVTTCARSMEFMFAGATAFDGDVSGFETGRVLTMGGMFEDAASFNGDLGSWDVFNVQNFRRMFGGASSFEGKGLDQWDTRCAEDISYMFYTAFSFNANINAWEVSRIKRFEFAFDDAKVFAQNLCPWTESIRNLDANTARAMFTGTSCPFNQELGPVQNPDEVGQPLTQFCFDCSKLRL